MNSWSTRLGWLMGLCAAPLLASRVARAADPAPEGEPAAPTRADAGRELSVDAAVRALLSQNLDLVAARIDEANAGESVRAEEARYAYVFGADAGYTRSTNARLGGNDTVTSTRTQTITAGAQLSRTFAFGTSATARVSGSRTESSGGSLPVGTVLVPGYNTTARLTVVHPLLRGSGRDVGELELRAARLGRVAAERSRRRLESQTVQSLLSSYWELWYADKSLEIDEGALLLARKQEDEARQKQQGGAIAPADLLTFESRTASLEESVVASELSRRQRSLALSVLLGDVSAEAAQLHASTAPSDPGAPLGRNAVTQAMMTDSPELAELEANVRVARERAAVAGDSLRPRLDLDGYVETIGVSDSWPNSAARASSVGWWSAHVGVTFEEPLGGSRISAARAQARYAVSSAENRLRSGRARVASDALTALATETAARRRLETSRRTLRVSERTLAAEEERWKLGQGLAILVLGAQEDLRRAQLRVERAKVDLALARVDLLHLTGHLLDEYGASR